LDGDNLIDAPFEPVQFEVEGELVTVAACINW
jgi:hypothetical protein